MKRGEIWWADLGAYRAREQTGRRPVIVWQSDTLTRLLQSVLVVPLTTNLDRAKLAGTALMCSARLKLEIFRSETGPLRNASQHRGPDFLIIVEGEDEVWLTPLGT